MSTDHIADFLTKAGNDTALGEKINLATAQALATLATEAGLPFTAEEFLAVQTTLSDSDLEGVSGGGETRPALIITNTFGRIISYKRVPVTTDPDRSSQ